MRQRSQTIYLHCAPLSFQRVTLTTRGRTVHKQLCLLECLLFCLIYFIIFLHPLSKHLLRPQHMNLCLGKHTIFLSFNIIYVASSHLSLITASKKKMAKAVFPTAHIFLAASSGEMLHYTSLLSVERKFIYLMMIQQKDETL